MGLCLIQGTSGPPAYEWLSNSQLELRFGAQIFGNSHAHISWGYCWVSLRAKHCSRCSAGLDIWVDILVSKVRAAQYQAGEFLSNPMLCGSVTRANTAEIGFNRYCYSTRIALRRPKEKSCNDILVFPSQQLADSVGPFPHFIQLQTCRRSWYNMRRFSSPCVVMRAPQILFFRPDPT